METRVPGLPTVLVIDDAPELRLLIASLVRNLGFEALTARDGETGIAMAREHEPDVICLDLMLPTISGLDVCRQLKADAQTSGVPIVMVSMRKLPQDRAAADQAGADAYLTKPIDRNQFSSCIRSLLWQRRLSENL